MQVRKQQLELDLEQSAQAGKIEQFNGPPRLLLPDLHTGFSRGRSGGLVFPSLSEFSTVYCDPHSQDFGIVNNAEVDVFLELSCFFHDPTNFGNLLWFLSFF